MVIADAACLLRCMSPEVARNGPPAMSAIWSLSGGKRTWRLRAPTSEFDAVDGSSTGTSVPWMWALLRLPRFRGASHADDNDNRFRHRQVGFPSTRSRCCWPGGHPSPIEAPLCPDVLPE